MFDATFSPIRTLCDNSKLSESQDTIVAFAKTVRFILLAAQFFSLHYLYVFITRLTLILLFNYRVLGDGQRMLVVLKYSYKIE